MISDFFGAVRRPSGVRSSQPISKPEFTVPEMFYKCDPAELKQQLQSRLEDKNTKDLRIMLREYLKYRRPHSKLMRNIEMVMQRYLSQDDYFELIHSEKEEEARRKIHYRMFTGKTHQSS